jgi:hypothetical protein
MKRIIYVHPSLGQLIAVVPDNAKLADDVVLVWDESLDGPVPDALIDQAESVSKVGKNLVLDSSKKSVADAKKAVKAGKDQAQKNSQNFLANLDLSQKLNASDLEAAVKALIALSRSN